MERKLDTILVLLARAQIALRRRAGRDAETLRGCASDLQCRAMHFEDHPTSTEDLAQLITDVAAYHARVRDYAATNGIYYVSPSSAPTLPALSRADILAAMPPGTNTPPPQIQAEIAEAQQLEEFEEPIPPSRPTERNLSIIPLSFKDFSDGEDDGS